jgi:hypothetical protein
MARTRKSQPADFDTFDTAFKPLHPFGEKGKLVSAEHLIQRRLAKDALEGKRKAITVVLRYAQAREKALREAEHLAFLDAQSNRGRRANTAMLLLSVASGACLEGPVKLEPWVCEMALSRKDAPMMSEREMLQMARFIRDAEAPEPAIFRLPAPPIRRSPEETRYKKGQSGNPKGRPKKQKGPQLPYSDYFEEIGTGRVHGKEKRMTRLQFLLHAINMKAIKGDSCMTAVLAGKYLQERLQQQKRDAANGLGFEVDHDQSWIAADPFQQVLRQLRITNRRTCSRVLLEPWVVEAALARFGERRLSLAEQTEVLRSASKPATVAWPDWWEIRTHAAAKPHLPIKRPARK